MGKLAETENLKTVYFGSSWGIFWKQPKYVSAVARLGPKKAGNRRICIVSDLDPVYKELRRSQKLVGGYIVINLAILVAIGLYRISRITLAPIQKLVRRAGEFTDSEVDFFNTDTASNEFGRLSGALNRMLKRIHADKKKLKEAVASLQQNNEMLKSTQHEMVRAEKLAAVGRLSAGIAHEIGNPVGISQDISIC